MINPLLHPYSSSAPTSPRCTRSALEHYGPGKGHAGITRRTGLAGVMAVPMRPLPVAGHHQQHQHRNNRRLSRVVKCRTVDFTEFPEGMRDYYNRLNGKRVLREIHSQPSSPLIPRIEIHDFGSEVEICPWRTDGCPVLRIVKTRELR